DEVERPVRGHAEEPGAHRGPRLEGGEPVPRRQERLLHGVVGVVEGAEHAVAVRNVARGGAAPPARPTPSRRLSGRAPGAPGRPSPARALRQRSAPRSAGRSWTTPPTTARPTPCGRPTPPSR